MKNYAPLTSDYGAQVLLRGISMGQFMIPGTYTAALMHSIRGNHHNFVTQLLLAPFALALRQIDDRRSRDAMFQQKTTVKKGSQH